MSSKKATVGRGRKYPTEELMGIIDKFIESKEFIVKLKYTELEEFAKTTLGFEDISYQDFRRNKEVKVAIDEFNNANTKVDIKGVAPTTSKMVKFHVDSFVEKYNNNPDMQKVVLNMFNQRYEDAFLELSKKNVELEESKNRIAELESQVKELRSKNTELSVSNRGLTTTNARLNKELEFNLNIGLYEDLISRKIVSPMDAENIQILLKNAGLIKGSEMVDIEEIDTIFTEEVIEHINEENDMLVSGNKEDTENIEETIKSTSKESSNLIDFFNNRK